MKLLPDSPVIIGFSSNIYCTYTERVRNNNAENMKTKYYFRLLKYKLKLLSFQSTKESMLRFLCISSYVLIIKV